jgi:hypothetical protein
VLAADGFGKAFRASGDRRFTLAAQRAKPAILAHGFDEPA